MSLLLVLGLLGNDDGAVQMVQQMLRHRSHECALHHCFALAPDNHQIRQTVFNAHQQCIAGIPLQALFGDMLDAIVAHKAGGLEQDVSALLQVEILRL